MHMSRFGNSSNLLQAEFGLPRFRSLSVADKSHIWLASLDIVVLVIFVWQAINEATGGPSEFANAFDPASAVRIWFTMTVRQSYLLFVASITLLHIRMGRPVSFGAKHWMLWAPTVLFVVTSTSIAGVISGAGFQSLFIGLVSYTSTIAILSSVAFTCLIGTLVSIKHNLVALNEEFDPWPPIRMMEEKPRPSFTTEDVDAIRDGASWITSNASSRRDSISAWSFSTHQTGATSSNHGHGFSRAHKGSCGSGPAKSSIWFGTCSPDVNHVPPVPPLPSPYGSASSTAHSSSRRDPFRREASPLSEEPRVRLDSQTSWLTSTNGSHTTMSAWSYPTSVRGGSVHNASSPDLHSHLTPTPPVSRLVKPQLASARVLGGYGSTPGVHEVEKGLAALAVPPGTTVDVSMLRLFGWLLYIWVPFRSAASTAVSVVLVLSVTMSSPILAITILFRSSIPIPSGLFDVREPHAGVTRTPSPDSDAPFRWSQDYKRSMSTSPTVVEGRRSGDIWITNGDAVDGKGRMGRAMAMLSPMPKLSVLPPEEIDEPFTPPLPIRSEDSSLHVNLHRRSYSDTSAQSDRLRKDSKGSSRLSEARESLAYAAKIMVAQRHYSALAQTVLVAGPFPEKNQSVEAGEVFGSATGAASANITRQLIHFRSRSISSISDPQTPTSGTSLIPTPPPTIPLPPTPPTVKAARLTSSGHKKSFSSGYTFGPVDDMNEIDALTVGVLPLLVPGLNMDVTKIKGGDRFPSGTFSESKSRKAAEKLEELRGDFSSPEVHSTPARHRAREQRHRKLFTHKRNRYSLPSFSLEKDDIHSPSRRSVEIRGASETKPAQHYTAVSTSTIEVGRRNIGESMPNSIHHLYTKQLTKFPPVGAIPLNRAISTRFLGLRADVPHGLDTPRESVSSTVPPFSAASTVTLFEDFVAGLEEDPEAQSTPHNTIMNEPTPRYLAPPLPLLKEKRRSSIICIKSDDHAPTTPDAELNTTSSVISALAQWSTRAVRPLIPNANKCQREKSKADSPQSNSKQGSPGGNLRPLMLLQDRDNTPARPMLNSTRPLALGKRQKVRGAVPVRDENVIPESASATSSRSRNLKPLKLVPTPTRSEAV
ncbi:hypothetical protein C0995_014870 [Termitomyces sp. Mi166|nr:hypothetical protein C0995_014870 [Termitomyces sp. Mi166\